MPRVSFVCGRVVVFPFHRVKLGGGKGKISRTVTDARFARARYPKLRRLQDLKRTLTTTHAHPPLHIPFNPNIESPRLLPTAHLLHPHEFDIILLRPPPTYSWPEITAIPIRQISGDPSFVFLWVGESSGEGLERGREALLRWGFRRCEEIVWVKRNSKRVGEGKVRGRAGWRKGDEVGVEEDGMPVNVLVNQKEHWLVGIRGTVRRKTDNWFVHCNVDTDVIVYEHDEPDPDEDSNRTTTPTTPPQLYTIIENFCLGSRRLELFAAKSSARRGWVTVGPDDGGGGVGDGVGVGEEEVQPFDSVRYGNYQEANKDEMGRYVLPLTQGEFAGAPPILEWQSFKSQVADTFVLLFSSFLTASATHAEIDHLRPKSPVRGERGGGETFHLPNRPQGQGHGDSGLGVGSRGRQGGNGLVYQPSHYQQGHQQQQQQQRPSQGILGSGPMPSLPVIGMNPNSNSNSIANQPSNPMAMMNAMNMMGMGMNGMNGMTGMNGMPMMGMGNMGMGFPMNVNMGMNMGMGMMPFGGMNMGMGGMGMMNPMMQGMFGGSQAAAAGNLDGNAQQSTAQGHASPPGNQQSGP